MAYIDFPDGMAGIKKRKAFWLSEDGLTLMAGWRRQGIPLTKIAEEYVGVSRTTFFNWYRESDGMRKALSVSLEIANLSVEEALLKRALGYDYYEETYDLIEGELRLAHRYKRHVAPEVKAILAWLYNRLPDRWRAQQEPLESTQYVNTVRDILVAMKEVAQSGEEVSVMVQDDAE